MLFDLTTLKIQGRRWERVVLTVYFRLLGSANTGTLLRRCNAALPLEQTRLGDRDNDGADLILVILAFYSGKLASVAAL
jgi:hypothetical protein